MEFPRIVIAALRGGAGKTTLSIGIIAAWKSLGKSIAPFKKGPDYIDTGWLALAAGRPCYNLDTFLIEEEDVLSSFFTRTRKNDIAVIEGNRGLYDGIDIEGRTSTAELAKLLKAPVVIGIDCSKTTRTMAAAVMGCMRFDPEVAIKGVILNRVAGSRHEQIVSKSIEYHCGIPVLGAVPKLKAQNFPERHMGLVPTPEHQWARQSISASSEMASRYLDLDALAEVASTAADLSIFKDDREAVRALPVDEKKPILSLQGPAPKIGIIKDSAFQFYYPENIEALAAEGAELVFTSPLRDTRLPDVDALYIGGGFPETHAAELSENKAYNDAIRSLATDGLPIYAECGGLMYLGEELVLEEKSYPMTGVLPVVFGFSQKPQGHGYTVITVDRENPYFAVGTELKGHEFHYSKVLKWRGDDSRMAFSMKRGVGFKNRKDGICYKNILATYSHIHALGTPVWARALIQQAVSYKDKK